MKKAFFIMALLSMVLFAGSAWATALVPTINFIEPEFDSADARVSTNTDNLPDIANFGLNPINKIEGQEYAQVVFWLPGLPIIDSPVVAMMAEADGSASDWIKLERCATIPANCFVNGYIATFWSDGASDFPTNLTPTPSTSDIIAGVVPETGKLQPVIQIFSHEAGLLVINAQSDFNEAPPGAPIPGSLVLLGSGIITMLGVGIRKKGA